MLPQLVLQIFRLNFTDIEELLVGGRSDSCKKKIKISSGTTIEIHTVEHLNLTIRRL